MSNISTKITLEAVKNGKCWMAQVSELGDGGDVAIASRVANTSDKPIAVAARMSGTESSINAAPGNSSVLTTIGGDLTPLDMNATITNLRMGMVGSPPFEITHQTAPVVIPTAVSRVTANQIAYYPMDEAEGLTVADQSGYLAPLNLALDGTAVWQDDGVLFDGASRVYNEAATKIYDALNNNDFTVESWFTPANSIGTSKRIVDVGVSANSYLLNLQHNSADLQYRLQNPLEVPPAASLTDVGAIVPGVQTHYVGRFRSTPGDTMLTYLNGVPQGSGFIGYESDVQSITSLGIGNVGWGTLDPTRAFTGLISLVCIYDRALSDAEILQNFQAGVPVKPPAVIKGRAIVTDPNGFYVPIINPDDGVFLVLRPGQSVTFDGSMNTTDGERIKYDLVTVELT